MMFRVHVLFGLFVWFLVSHFVLMPFFVLFFVLVGSFFVDVDSYSSKIGRRLKVFSWWMKHRGFFHSLVASVLLSLIVGLVGMRFCVVGVEGCWGMWAGFGFFVGYLSHLVLDCFTLSGVRLFWPFRFKVKGFLKSGGWIEDVVFVLLLVVDVLFVLNKLF